MKPNGITVVRDESYFTKSINRDKRVSLKGKGLLGLVLDLPASWDFSIRGLVAVCKESKDAIGTAIQELRAFGYCRMEEVREGGKFAGYHYTFYEVSQDPDKILPKPEKPYPGKPDAEKPYPGNPPQYKDINNNNTYKGGEGENRKQNGGNDGGSQPPKAGKDPLPESVLIWLRIMQIEITDAGVKLISKRVTNLPAWEATLEGWIANPNWSKSNIDGQLERYDKKVRSGDYPQELRKVAESKKDPAKVQEEEDYKSLIYGK